jgi:hypothetical protein
MNATTSEEQCSYNILVEVSDEPKTQEESNGEPIIYFFDILSTVFQIDDQLWIFGLAVSSFTAPISSIASQ